MLLKAVILSPPFSKVMCFGAEADPIVVYVDEAPFQEDRFLASVQRAVQNLLRGGETVAAVQLSSWDEGDEYAVALCSVAPSTSSSASAAGAVPPAFVRDAGPSADVCVICLEPIEASPGGCTFACGLGHALCRRCTSSYVILSCCAGGAFLRPIRRGSCMEEITSRAGQLPCPKFIQGECLEGSLPLPALMPLLTGPAASLLLDGLRETAAADVAGAAPKEPAADDVARALGVIEEALALGLRAKCPGVGCPASFGKDPVGCMHMTCNACGTRFCFACERARVENCGCDSQSLFMHDDVGAAERSLDLFHFRLRAMYLNEARCLIGAHLWSTVRALHPDALKDVGGGLDISERDIDEAPRRLALFGRGVGRRKEEVLRRRLMLARHLHAKGLSLPDPGRAGGSGPSSWPSHQQQLLAPRMGADDDDEAEVACSEAFSTESETDMEEQEAFLLQIDAACAEEGPAPGRGATEGSGERREQAAVDGEKGGLVTEEVGAGSVGGADRPGSGEEGASVAEPTQTHVGGGGDPHFARAAPPSGPGRNDAGGGTVAGEGCDGKGGLEVSSASFGSLAGDGRAARRAPLGSNRSRAGSRTTSRASRRRRRSRSNSRRRSRSRRRRHGEHRRGGHGRRADARRRRRERTRGIEVPRSPARQPAKVSNVELSIRLFLGMCS